MAAQDPDDDALRSEIQAAIAAGRELGPDMDRQLAESVLERYRKEQAARQRAVAAPQSPRPPAPAVDGEAIGRTVLALGALAAFVVIVVLKPEFWWVIFFLPAIAAAWGWDRRAQRK